MQMSKKLLEFIIFIALVFSAFCFLAMLVSRKLKLEMLVDVFETASVYKINTNG